MVFCLSIIFSSIVTTISIKVRLICLQNKASLIKIDLIIYISTATIVIAHIGLLSLFAGTFHKESQIRILKAFRG